MKLTRESALRIILTGLLLGIFTDVLARQNITGLNFLLFTSAWAGICLAVVLKHNRSIRQPLLYAGLAVANAAIVCWRAAILVQFWSIILTLLSLSLLAATAFIENYVSLPLLSRIPAFFSRYKQMALGTPKELSTALSQKSELRIAINRGILGAAVLAVIFVALFASADQVLGNSFHWLSSLISSLQDFLRGYDVGRVVTIGFWSAVSLIALLLLRHRESVKIQATRVIKPSLSGRDAHTILWTLVTIFALFVLLQLRYLFAGASLPDGLTYATYAHRGYGQLLVATLLAGAVIKYVVTALKERATLQTKILATALIVLNGIVIISAWKRLSLYETTYGWTMTRFVARLGLVCILLGSVSLVVWLWGRLSSRQFYASGWLIVTVVLMTAAVLNPEGIIAHKNIVERPGRDVVLDTNYISTLSADALPAICHSAPEINTAYPKEYAALADASASREATHNHGLSWHYTGTKSFNDHYGRCL